MSGVRSSIATHPQRGEIDQQIRAGTPAAQVARDFDLSRQAVSRYKSKLAANPAATGDPDRDAMRRQIKSLYNATVDLVKTAKAANAPKAFLAATGEARRCLSLMSKIMGLLNDMPPAPVAAVTVNIDVQELQSVILGALGDYPEARVATAAALVEYHDKKANEGEV